MKKKILVYNGQLFMGGIERVLITYLQGLSKEEDLEVDLLIKENDPEKNVFYEDIPKNIKCTFVKSVEEVKTREEISRKKKKNIFYRCYYQLFLAMERKKMKSFVEKYFLENRYDYVIDFDMSLGKYLDAIPYKKIGWNHFSLIGKVGKKRERFRKRLQKYDKVVTICDEMLEELKEIYPEVKDRGVTLYNPMDILRIEKESKEKVSQEDRELLNEEYMVGVSRLVKGKGREDLIDIYKILKEQGIKEKLYLIGDGPEYENLKIQIKNYGLEKDVLLLGQKKNPYVWMKNSKLFLHSSYGEGLPTVLIEAMICGTVIVAYDCKTGPKEILDYGNTGILVPTGDKKIFAEKTLEYLNGKVLKETFEKNYEDKINQFKEKTIITRLRKIMEI